MKMLKCCKLNLMQWRIQPKYIIVLCFLILHTFDQVFPYKAFAQSADLKIAPWLLSGLVRGANWYMITMLAYILLISDAPFLNRQQQFVLQRVGKIHWLRGQLLYLLVQSFLVAMLTWVMSWCFLLPEVEWTTQWGSGIQSASRHTVGYMVRPPFVVYTHVLKNWSAVGATAWVFLMQILIGLFLGELVLVCNLWTRRGIGVSLAVFWVLLYATVKIWSQSAGFVKYLAWISPLCWMDLTLTGDTGIYQPPLWYAAVVLILLCVGLAVFALCNIHKCSLDMDKE